MKLSTLNPIPHVKKAIDTALDKTEDQQQSEDANTTTDVSTIESDNTTTDVSTIESDNTGLDAVPVDRGVWIDASQMIDSGSAAKRTEDFRRIVQSFDEDRQDLLARIVGKFFITLAYLLPLLLGWYAGLALGDTLTGPFNVAAAYNTFAHLISVGLELSIPMLGYAVATTFKRAAKDRSQVGICAVLLAVFLALATGNALTQEVLLYHAIPQTSPGQIVAVWFRSFGPSIIDILSTVFIAVVGVKNLKKYLADQREKIHATREVALVHIEMDKTSLQAAIDKQTALGDMQSKAKRADTWNQIEGMQADAMIEQAKRNMIGDGNTGGSFRRSRY